MIKSFVKLFSLSLFTVSFALLSNDFPKFPQVLEVSASSESCISGDTGVIINESVDQLTEFNDGMTAKVAEIKNDIEGDITNKVREIANKLLAEGREVSADKLTSQADNLINNITPKSEGLEETIDSITKKNRDKYYGKMNSLRKQCIGYINKEIKKLNSQSCKTDKQDQQSEDCDDSKIKEQIAEAEEQKTILIDSETRKDAEADRLNVLLKSDADGATSMRTLSKTIDEVKSFLDKSRNNAFNSIKSDSARAEKIVNSLNLNGSFGRVKATGRGGQQVRTPSGEIANLNENQTLQISEDGSYKVIQRKLGAVFAQ